MTIITSLAERLKGAGWGLAALAATLAAPALAAAADFPTKPVRIIVPAAPGGALDLTTRLVAQKMGEKLGQTVIVDNRPGADNLTGIRMAKDAAPDGYTMLAQANGFTMLPYIKAEPGFDPLRDFTAVGVMTRSPMMLDVGFAQPYQTVADLLARAKADAGKLTYGSAGVGSPGHIVGAMFMEVAGVKAVHVPYKGTAAALPDVAGGRVDMIFDGYIGSLPYVKGRKIRSLAVTSTGRILPQPDVPTLREAGIPYDFTLWLGLLAPAGTPPAAVATLSEALRYATSSRELNDRFLAESSDPSFLTPAEFGDLIARDYATNGRIAAKLNLPRE